MCIYIAEGVTGLYLLKGTGLKLQSACTLQDRDLLLFQLGDFVSLSRKRKKSLSCRVKSAFFC